jgi:mannosylglycoprotein endo-beta-mannosidase
VLGTLLKNKLIPDPFYGLNNQAIIDIADAGREYYTFWFFTTFQCALVRRTAPVLRIFVSHVFL